MGEFCFEESFVHTWNSYRRVGEFRSKKVSSTPGTVTVEWESFVRRKFRPHLEQLPWSGRVSFKESFVHTWNSYRRVREFRSKKVSSTPGTVTVEWESFVQRSFVHTWNSYHRVGEFRSKKFHPHLEQLPFSGRVSFKEVSSKPLNEESQKALLFHLIIKLLESFVVLISFLSCNRTHPIAQRKFTLRFNFVTKGPPTKSTKLSYQLNFPTN